MELTARPNDCFATRCVLRLGGEPIGTLRSSAWRERIGVRLYGQRRLVYERRMRGRYVLADGATG